MQDAAGMSANLHMVGGAIFTAHLPFGEIIVAYEKALRKRRGLLLVHPTTGRTVFINPQQCVYLESFAS
jgi:hypothetical protein